MPGTSSAEQLLEDGSDVVGPVLESAGYVRTRVVTGHGSGGAFAHRRWVKGRRYVELHVRLTLGQVYYGWDDHEIEHSRLLRAVRRQGSFPGFGIDRMDAFLHLADDLRGPTEFILNCARSTFDATAEAAANLPGRVLP